VKIKIIHIEAHEKKYLYDNTIISQLNVRDLISTSVPGKSSPRDM